MTTALHILMVLILVLGPTAIALWGITIYAKWLDAETNPLRDFDDNEDWN